MYRLVSKLTVEHLHIKVAPDITSFYGQYYSLKEYISMSQYKSFVIHIGAVELVLFILIRLALFTSSPERWLIGELIVYPWSGVRPPSVRSQF